MEEKRDTSGDTKVFKIIRREDIEREKRRQANEAEKAKQMSDVAKARQESQAVKIREVNIAAKARQATQAEKIKQANMEAKARQVSNAAKLKKVNGEFKSNQSAEVKKKIEAINKENVSTGKVDKQNSTSNTNSNIINNKTLSSVKENSNNKTINNSRVIDNKAINNAKASNEINSNKLNQNNNVTEEHSKLQNSKEKPLKILLVLIIIILVATILSTVFGVINLNTNKIINGVKVNDVKIANMTKEQAIEELNNNINDAEKNIVTIKRNDYQTKISLSDIEGKFDVESIVNEAYNIGRANDVIGNNYKTIGAFVIGKNLRANLTYNEELLEEKIKEISLEMPDLAMDSTYVIDGNKLIIKNSTAGIKIQKDNFKQSLINALSSSQKEFELPIEKAEKQEIDIKKIYDEVYKQPVNAYYTTNPLKVYKEESGLDFAISIEEAEKLLKENKTEYEIPLKVLKPQITIADLGDAAFPDTLGTFTTTYGTADVNRNANIALAAQSINSVVVMPGETFSYNDLIGECSTARGYKVSTVYLNGELSTGIGGGICQVSTTLYNAVLRANLEIVQRRNHSLGVTYVPAGQDAMVNIGTSDFKFKNNREYPVKVIAYVNPGSVTCAIKGIKQETEYEVKLESRTIEKNDVRYKVETYKVLYLNGNVVSRTWLSTDTYKYH